MSTSDKYQPPKGSVLDKYVSQQPKQSNAEPGPTITECYTEMPTHVAMLDLVDEAGNHTALPYHALESAQFNLSGTIILKYHVQEVTLSGLNLKPVYDGVIRHKMNRITVRGQTALQPGNSTSVLRMNVTYS